MKASDTALLPERRSLMTSMIEADPPELLTHKRVRLADGVYLTRHGIVFSDEPLSLEEYCLAVSRCTQIANACQWGLGDLIIFGEDHAEWGERYSQALEATGKSYDTLRQCVRTARAYPMTDRLPTVSFSHHREALAVPPEERRAVLEDAAAAGISSAALREQLAAASPPQRTVCPQCGHEW